jgi:hypothetical protein
MKTATQFEVKGHSSAKTVTTYSASSSVSFFEDFRAEIFGTEYVIEFVSYRAKWTGDIRKNDVIVEIGFYTVVADGKKGKKYNTRQFTVADVAVYTTLPADLLDALNAQLGAEIVKAVA